MDDAVSGVADLGDLPLVVFDDAQAVVGVVSELVGDEVGGDGLADEGGLGGLEFYQVASGVVFWLLVVALGVFEFGVLVEVVGGVVGLLAGLAAAGVGEGPGLAVAEGVVAEVVGGVGSGVFVAVGGVGELAGEVVLVEVVGWAGGAGAELFAAGGEVA